MRAKLANLNHCAVPFLSRAVANLCWYYYVLVRSYYLGNGKFQQQNNLINLYIVNEGKETHFLLNFTLSKIKLAQIMNNRVYFVCNTCYFDVQ